MVLSCSLPSTNLDWGVAWLIGKEKWEFLIPSPTVAAEHQKVLERVGEVRGFQRI